MDDIPEIREDEKSVWEKPETIRLLWIGLIAGCIFSVIAGFIYNGLGLLVKEPHFEDYDGFLGWLGYQADKFPVFYGAVGFFSFTFIVLFGKNLRAILMRPEDYYDHEEGEKK